LGKLLTRMYLCHQAV